MSLEWSLKEIYPSFTSKEFINDLKKVDDEIEGLKEFAKSIDEKSNDLVKLEELINKLESINLLINRIGSYANLTLSTDSKNAEGRKYLDVINSKYSLLAEP